MSIFLRLFTIYSQFWYILIYVIKNHIIVYIKEIKNG